MTPETITSEQQLAALVQMYAEGIVEEEQRNDPQNWEVNLENVLHDKVHDWVDGCEHVIYHYKALQIVAHCNTDRGEQFVEDMGTKYTNVNQLASAIVYGELESRIVEKVQDILEATADLEDA